jgi:hypothetical protein
VITISNLAGILSSAVPCLSLSGREGQDHASWTDDTTATCNSEVTALAWLNDSHVAANRYLLFLDNNNAAYTWISARCSPVSRTVYPSGARSHSNVGCAIWLSFMQWI